MRVPRSSYLCLHLAEEKLENQRKHVESGFPQSERAVSPCPSYLLIAPVSFLRVSRLFHFCGNSTWHLIRDLIRTLTLSGTYGITWPVFLNGKAEAQIGEITCLRTHSKMSAFSASFYVKGKLLHQMSFCWYPRVQSKL